jgi:hypothetical protein
MNCSGAEDFIGNKKSFWPGKVAESSGVLLITRVSIHNGYPISATTCADRNRSTF